VSIEPVAPNSPCEFAAVEFVAILYLAAPVMLFFATWLSPPAAVLLVSLSLVALAPFRPRLNTPIAPALPMLLVVAIVSVAWSSLGGAGHFFHANPVDWRARDAVLHDLVVGAWPPAYGILDGHQIFLRCPLGYFLIPAALGKAFGIDVADLLLYAWTSFGVALALWLVVDHLHDRRTKWAFLLLFPLFSGMDLAGWLTTQGKLPAVTQHIEWWAGLYQYSSNSTLLFWVPNHALAGWIAAALLLRHWNRSLLLVVCALGWTTPMWSPMVTVGLLPFALAAAIVSLKNRTDLHHASFRTFFVSVALFVAVAAYLTYDTDRVKSFWIWSTELPAATLLARHILFVGLEIGLLGMVLLHYIPRATILYISIGSLVLIPLYVFGNSNDFVMRASIIPLAILSVFVAGLLVRGPPVGRAASLVVVLIGAVTPAQEISRALMLPSWPASRKDTIMDVAEFYPLTYVAKHSDRVMFGQLKKPVDIPRP
jgi:hypothetical protein